MFHFLYILNALQDSQYALSPYNTLKHFLDTVTIASNPLSSLIAFDCVEYYTPEQLKDHFF